MANLIKYLIIFVLFLSCNSFAKELDATSGAIISFPQEKYFGDDKVKPSIYSIYAQEISKIENYLNSFETFTASFKQSSRGGGIRYGKIFINKPGKIRCEYLAPSPMLLIMKENKIILYDYDLDEASYTSSDINSLKLLALQNLKFHDINLVEIEKDEHFIELTIKEYIDQSNQILLLTLKFSYPQIALKQITITTEESDIDLILDKITYNQTLGKQLFYLNRDLLRKDKIKF